MAANARSASAATSVGDLPPNSSVTGVRNLAAASNTCTATKPLPVYMMWSKRCFSSSFVSGTPPCTTRMASESKYFSTRRSMSTAHAGDISDGLMTAVLPAAMAATRGAKHSCICRRSGGHACKRMHMHAPARTFTSTTTQDAGTVTYRKVPRCNDACLQQRARATMRCPSNVHQTVINKCKQRSSTHARA